MAFLPSWYGFLCSFIVVNVLFETGISGKSNPLEADDILKKHSFGNHHQCQRLCWYIELCERFSFYTKNLDDAHPYNCVLHAGEEKDDDVSDGWMQEKASGDYLASGHGCRNRTCGKEKVCIPLAMPDVKNVCNDLPADVNECASSPCQNGTCVDGDRAYTCNCFPGYNGSNCETEIDECASSPCQNGSCVNQVNAYTCNCRAGYNGSHCETDINECASSPCRNGGSCVDEVNNYTCNCPAGYNGSNCETDINECFSNPCQNNGSCVDQVNAYTCNCPAGYTGDHCETDIDECESNPCPSGEGCEDTVNGYNCCPPGYSGTTCSESWLKATCTTDTDCTKDQTGCYSGHCLCKDGYFFSHSQAACVQTCDRLETNYLHYKDKDLSGNILKQIHDVPDSTTCAAQCSTDPQCKTFVLFERTCYMKIFTGQDGNWTFKLNAHMYQRTCE